MAEAYGKEMAIFPFKGKPRVQNLNESVYLFDVAFHPTKPWLVGWSRGGLVAMDFNGRVLWTLEHAGQLSSLEWCANRERLAFEVMEAGRFVGTRYLEIQSRTLRRVAFEGRGPSWSADCEELLLSTESQVFRYNLGSQKARALVEGSAAAWSPDGQSIVYRGKDGAFWLAAPSGMQGRRLFDGDNVLDTPRWSPDSQYLLFLRKGERGLDLTMECLEAKQVVVYRLRDGRWAWVHQVCKSAPTNFRWIKKPALLDLSPVHG